jgi:hypothetical protein
MLEEYKIISDFDNYEVSNYGNVKNIKTNRILKKNVDVNGYYTVHLSKKNIATIKRIHRLVCETFIENTENKLYVDHIDNNKLYNNIENLRWCTSQENNRNRKLSSRNKSSVKGVCFNKQSNKWHAQIRIDGILIHLGSYENLEDAKNVRITKANEFWERLKIHVNNKINISNI